MQGDWRTLPFSGWATLHSGFPSGAWARVAPESCDILDPMADLERPSDTQGPRHETAVSLPLAPPAFAAKAAILQEQVAALQEQRDALSPMCAVRGPAAREARQRLKQLEGGTCQSESILETRARMARQSPTQAPLATRPAFA